MNQSNSLSTYQFIFLLGMALLVPNNQVVASESPNSNTCAWATVIGALGIYVAGKRVYSHRRDAKKRLEGVKGLYDESNYLKEFTDDASYAKYRDDFSVDSVVRDYSNGPLSPKKVPKQSPSSFITSAGKDQAKKIDKRVKHIKTYAYKDPNKPSRFGALPKFDGLPTFDTLSQLDTPWLGERHCSVDPIDYALDADQEEYPKNQEEYLRNQEYTGVWALRKTVRGLGLLGWSVPKYVLSLGWACTKYAVPRGFNSIMYPADDIVQNDDFILDWEHKKDRLKATTKVLCEHGEDINRRCH